MSKMGFCLRYIKEELVNVVDPSMISVLPERHLLQPIIKCDPTKYL